MCYKVFYLSLVFLLGVAEFVKGSCLEYGHSCWGAHGKRSGGKVFPSIGGAGSQEPEEKLDASIVQEKVKPNELLNILMDRNVRINPDDMRGQYDLTVGNNDNQNAYDVPDHRLRTKVKDELRRNSIFHYLPNLTKYPGPRSATGSPLKRRSNLPAGSSRDYYQGENYPQSDLDVEYLNLK